MTNEIDQLIWNVLDGKASGGGDRELKAGWKRVRNNGNIFANGRKYGI